MKYKTKKINHCLLCKNKNIKEVFSLGNLFVSNFVKKKDIKNGIIKIDLKGRLQEIKFGKLKKIIGSNRLVCDGGHNINAAKAITNWIKQQNQDVHLIIGMMKK